MEGKRFGEFAPDGVAGGKAGEFGVVLAGAEVVLADFGVVELAGEHEGVVRWRRSVNSGDMVDEGVAEGFVGVGADWGGVGVDQHAGAAESVVEVEVFAAGSHRAVVLSQDLAVGVNIPNGYYNFWQSRL